MDNLKEIFCDFNCYSILIRIILSAVIGGAIGSERGRHGRAAGLRTHILVCVGAAITSLTSQFLTEELGCNGDISRLSAQVISGIGFLGAGTILIRNSSVITGLTTAAGMWTTAAIGVAVGFGFYWGGIAAAVICIFSVTFLSRLEKNRKNNIYIYSELTDIMATENVVSTLKSIKNALISYDIIPAKSGNSQNLGIMCLVNEEHYFEIEEALQSNDNIAFTVCDISL